MKKSVRSYLTAFALMFALSAFTAVSFAQENPMVGGEMMYKTKNIIENAVNSKDHTTLVAAVQAAGLVETLQGKGPFTVFAPVNDAFNMLPAGTVDMLLKPENKEMLIKILTYHVIAGKYDSKKLMEEIMAGGGKTELKTVAGGTLSFSMDSSNKILVWDEKGNSAMVTIADVYQSNGVIMVIDKVLMPM
jgi:uncharacterized surface protein with fasciclin (FAS1) repeats